VIVWLFIVMINATLSFTEGDAFIDHCLVWSTLSLAFSLFALMVAGRDKEKWFSLLIAIVSGWVYILSLFLFVFNSME